MAKIKGVDIGLIKIVGNLTARKRTFPMDTFENDLIIAIRELERLNFSCSYGRVNLPLSLVDVVNEGYRYILAQQNIPPTREASCTMPQNNRVDPFYLSFEDENEDDNENNLSTQTWPDNIRKHFERHGFTGDAPIEPQPGKSYENAYLKCRGFGNMQFTAKNCIVDINTYTSSEHCTFEDCVIIGHKYSLSSFTRCTIYGLYLHECTLKECSFVDGNPQIYDCQIEQSIANGDTTLFLRGTVANFTELNVYELRAYDSSTVTCSDTRPSHLRYLKIEYGSSVAYAGELEIEYPTILGELTATNIIPRECKLCHTKQIAYNLVEHRHSICRNCFSIKSYSTPNTFRVVDKGDMLPSFSFEYEIAYSDMNKELEEAIVHLLEAGFIRASDGTVSEEIKSPIFTSISQLDPVSEHLSFLSRYIDRSCGTHIHVDNVYDENCEYLKQHAYPIFGALTEKVCRRCEDDTHFWGRSFNDYAEPKVGGDRKYNWINMSHRETLEWRLPRFTSLIQFVTVIDFVRQATLIARTKSKHFQTRADKIVSLYEDKKAEVLKHV